jgi:hypothetical protein
MKHPWLLAAVVSLAAILGACRKDHRAEQLAALDNAYQSGVISKAEYDAKRQALGGAATPAAPVPQTPGTPSAAPSVAAVPTPPPVPAAPAAAPVPAGAAAEGQTAPPRTSAAPAEPSPQLPASRAAQPSQAVPPPEPPRPAGAVPQTPPAEAAQAPTAPRNPPPARPSPGAAADNEAPPRPLAGCDDAEYRSGNVKGTRQRFFPAPAEAVRKAARDALGSLDFNIHRDSGNEMEASKRRHIGALVGAGGERLILHFERSRQGNQPGTLVTGETRKSLIGRLAQKSWTNAILAQIACHLRAAR